MKNPSTAPDRDAVIHHAKMVRDTLERTIFALPGRGTVTEHDLTNLAAQLRGLAKSFDRYAPARGVSPGPVVSGVQGQGPVWTYPGQQR